MSRTILLAALVVSLGFVTGRSAEAPYRQTGEIHADLEDFSPTTIDGAAGRLLIASKRGVFSYDLKRDRLDGRFSDVTGGPLAVAPDLGRVMIVSAGSATLLDRADGRTMSSSPLSGWVSAVLYDGARQEFLVDRRGDHRRDLFVFDRDGRQIRRLSGFNDFGPVELAPPRRLLMGGDGRISVVDIETGSTAEWKVPGRRRVNALAFDPVGNHAFAAVDGTIVMLDGTTGTRLASLATAGVMVLGYDRAARRLVYGWNADGTGDEAYVTAVDVQADRLVPVQQLRIPRGPHDLQFNSAAGGFTLAVDPDVGAFRRLVFERR